MAMRIWSVGLNAPYFVTANFNRDVSYNGAREALRSWHLRLDRRLLGPKWQKKPAENRTQFIAYVEHLSSNLHWHLLVRPPGHVSQTEFSAAAKDAWGCLVEGGSLDIQIARSKADREKVASYCTKDLWIRENYEKFVLSTEFLS